MTKAGWSVLVALLVTPGASSAQAPRTEAAGLHGSVVDAKTGVPLAGVTVTLELIPYGIFSGSEPGVSGFLSTARRAVTGPSGTYRLEGLTQGTYRLRVVRLGYKSMTLDVHYDGPADPRVSIGLEVEPVQLEPIEVVARPVEGMSQRGSLGAATAQSDRIQLERLRQLQHLQADARVVSSADLLEAVTLGETDLLRALHRLPGVTAADDWSAEPWTRGSRWDETRIYFDGLPILDPVHAGGAFTSISPDLVGSLTFYPGVRPVEMGSASAGIVDLRSRPASGEERLSALGQISLLSGRISANRPLGPGSGVTFSARRSYLEEATSAEKETGGRGYVPLRFADFGGRWDQTLGSRLKIELSGLKTEDQVLGDWSEEIKGTRAKWGNSVIRGTLQLDHFGVRTRLTVGESRYESSVRFAPFDPGRSDLFTATTSAPLDNDVRFDLTEITVTPFPSGSAPPTWQIGAQVLATTIDYDGPAPWPYPDAVNAGNLSEHSSSTRGALWGRLRRRVTPTIEISAGLRLEPNGRSGQVASDVTMAPRLAATWQPNPDLRLSGALGRHYQYEQALAGTGFEVGPALVPSHLWVAAHGDVPAIRADKGTLGAELWLPGGWLASANGYARISTGHLTPPPERGYVRARPVLSDGAIGAGWVIGRTDAFGMELGIRKLTGRWTGSASYSLSRARMTASDRTYTAPGDRPHVFDVTFLVQATRKIRIGAAYTAASGAPYTRFYSFRCPSDPYPVYCPPQSRTRPR